MGNCNLKTPHGGKITLPFFHGSREIYCSTFPVGLLIFLFTYASFDLIHHLRGICSISSKTLDQCFSTSTNLRVWTSIPRILLSAITCPSNLMFFISSLDLVCLIYVEGPNKSARISFLKKLICYKHFELKLQCNAA